MTEIEKLNLLKTLVNNPTETERMVRGKLKEKKIRFTFQAIFSYSDTCYFLDFLVHPNKKTSDVSFFAIEIDGISHQKPSNIIKDALRDDYLLKNFNVKTVRFTNGEVYKNVDKVIEEIMMLDLKKGEESFSIIRQRQMVKEEENKNSFDLPVVLNCSVQKLKKQIEFHKNQAQSKNISDSFIIKHYTAYQKLVAQLKIKEQREEKIKQRAIELRGGLSVKKYSQQQRALKKDELKKEYLNEPKTEYPYVGCKYCYKFSDGSYGCTKVKEGFCPIVNNNN